MDRPDLELLRGAIDMHAHTAPALFKRHIDDAALAEHAIEAGMRGFVLKDHDASTTGRAYHVNRMYPQVQLFGAVVLNRSVGGLNPYVAEAAIHYGARVVWMPSNHSKHHADYFGLSDYPQFGRPRKQLPGEGVTVFEEDGAQRSSRRPARSARSWPPTTSQLWPPGTCRWPRSGCCRMPRSAPGLPSSSFTHANWYVHASSDLDVQSAKPYRQGRHARIRRLVLRLPHLLGAAARATRRVDQRAGR